MSYLLVNWKTTLSGIAAVLTALGDVITQLASGNVGSGQLEKDFLAIVVGIGLIFAKDANK